ncbi:MAG TPA: VCBS repeat-containing protein, partial [Chitinophagaceae bacterium]|nr:VCBS repeat-containing protein [Chitinophagaceae bacterium]
VTVRYNDFNKDGALDAFLFAYNNGKEFPTLTRTTLVEQISSLKKRIFYHSDYGKMGYKELFSSAERDGAKELVAFQLASVYIENKGGGNFALKPLPMAAQIAPINGVLPYDIDDDGNLDILAIGNSYAPEALSGRYDAAIGWVLKGDGEGNFVPLLPQQSGFVVRGDARSLVKFQRADRTSMIMASVNSGPLKLFQEREKRNILSLPRGTVYALYALSNGKQRKEEFFYGSSYLSQSGRFITLDKHIKKLRCVGQNGKIIMERDLQN